MLVACLGDVMLDVIVELDKDLNPDDDTPARITFSAGGQAANVAAWVAALGGAARVFGPRPDTGAGRLVEEALRRQGVEVTGSATGRAASALSLLSGGTRSLASDPGDVGWLRDVRFGDWLDGADWLFVSGYALLRAPDPQRLVETAGAARAHGARVAVDLASAAMIEEYGAAAFSSVCRALRPSVVFATDAEWDVTSAGLAGPSSTGAPGGSGSSSTLVLKHGRRGASFVADGVSDDREALPGPVVDVTGAGDALAAGFLLGGADLALSAAATCVAQVGAQPADGSA